MSRPRSRSPPGRNGTEPKLPVNILVVGECGDGKSTLVNALRDPASSAEPLTGKNPNGVTKDILLYRCHDLEDGVQFNLLDTPGVGDGTVTPIALIALIEQFLSSGMVPGGIRGVIVTNPIPDCRVKLGAQVVQIIVDKGFVGAEGTDKYANILLAGTKADRADEDERANFMHGTEGNESVRQLFFQRAEPPGEGVAVMVHKGDYAPLLEAIRKLPAVTIGYQAPDNRVMAEALAEKMGMEPEAFEEQIGAMRDLVKEQSAQIKELMGKMFEAEEEHRRQMAKRDQQMMEIQQRMLDDQRKAEEMRQQQQRDFEALRKEEQEERRKEQAAAQKRWEEDNERNQALLKEMRAQQAADRANHESAMRMMQQANQEAFQQAREASAAAQRAAANQSSGGGGCQIL